uniref:Secreted protein n=1 Tax=Physcomitrium patens TaxID=3218 RepID=A0A2K1IVP8_PHYPA|nr:hypothetical protein PHYPA_025295 [Physcomitrium patens]
MAKAIRGVGFLLVCMRVVLQEVPRMTVGAVETVSSDEITTDFARGGIDVAGLIRQDLITLPLVGFCGLATKLRTPHSLETAVVLGTFRTTFEFLPEDSQERSRRRVRVECELSVILPLQRRVPI